MQTAQLRRRNFLFLLGDDNGIGFFLIDLAAQISFLVLRIREEQDLHIIKRDILAHSAQMTLLILAAIQRALFHRIPALVFLQERHRPRIDRQIFRAIHPQLKAAIGRVDGNARSAAIIDQHFRNQIERTVRKLKREQTAYKAAGLEEDAQSVTARIRRLNAEYKSFSEAAGLPLQRERMKVEY